MRKRVDAMGKTLQNPALFVDGTDVFDAKTLHITNRWQLAVMRSAVRSRLSPPKQYNPNLVPIGHGFGFIVFIEEVEDW